MSDLAKAIREAREAKGLTTTELGAAIGSSAQTVWLWERGRQIPSTAAWLRLCAFLGLDPMSIDPETAAMAPENEYEGKMTRYTLWANVPKPVVTDGSTEQNWTTFRASHDDDARLTASLLLVSWRRHFGGYSDVQLRNDEADRTVVLGVSQ